MRALNYLTPDEKVEMIASSPEFAGVVKPEPFMDRLLQFISGIQRQPMAGSRRLGYVGDSYGAVQQAELADRLAQETRRQRAVETLLGNDNLNRQFNYGRQRDAQDEAWRQRSFDYRQQQDQQQREDRKRELDRQDKYNQDYLDFWKKQQEAPRKPTASEQNAIINRQFGIATDKSNQGLYNDPKEVLADLGDAAASPGAAEMIWENNRIIRETAERDWNDANNRAAALNRRIQLKDNITAAGKEKQIGKRGIGPWTWFYNDKEAAGPMNTRDIQLWTEEDKQLGEVTTQKGFTEGLVRDPKTRMWKPATEAPRWLQQKQPGQTPAKAAAPKAQAPGQGGGQLHPTFYAKVRELMSQGMSVEAASAQALAEMQ